MKPAKQQVVWLWPLLLLGCAAGTAALRGEPEELALARSELPRDKSRALSEEERQVACDESRDFALALYGEARPARGNVAVSPYSVRTALSMVYAGAGGETAAEMARVLRFSSADPAAVHAVLNATDLELQGRVHDLTGAAGENPGQERGDLELRVANLVVNAEGFAFNKSYLDVLSRYYGAGVYSADLAREPESRLAINRWFSDRTRARIKDPLPPSALRGASLVLANALYFRGSWLNRFDPARTAREVFHAPSGDVTTAMMNDSGKRLYGTGDGYAAVELKYVGSSLRMLFILPDSLRFDEIERALDRDFLQQARAQMSRRKVLIKVPKFTVESDLALVPAMKRLGMRQVFDPTSADLSGIADASSALYVSQIYHQTFVAVDEQGTEASAATASVIAATSASQPVVFFLTRPFLFLIHDDPTGQILFVGRVEDPSL